MKDAFSLRFGDSTSSKTARIFGQVRARTNARHTEA